MCKKNLYLSYRIIGIRIVENGLSSTDYGGWPNTWKQQEIREQPKLKTAVSKERPFFSANLSIMILMAHYQSYYRKTFRRFPVYQCHLRHSIYLYSTLSFECIV